MHVYIIIIFTTLLCCLALVQTQHWHGHLSLDSSSGVQNHHTEPTPRIGGVGIAIGLCLAWWLAAAEVRVVLGSALLASIPAFCFGLAEDLTKKVGVTARLLATMLSGFLAWYLTGVAMQNTGFPPLDWLLRLTPVAVVFTAFAVGGVANAVNIIDGFNGLASGSVAIMIGAIGIMAFNVGDPSIGGACFLIVAVALGFSAVNWPMGRLFLGDGGAYLLGFLLAWMAILLPMRNPQLNAWATILVCAYPVIEVFFSVVRRHRREGHHPGQPDKVHLHHLIHRRVICKLFPHLGACLKNGLTSPICWAFVSIPAGLAVVFAQDTPMLVLAFGSLFVGYFSVYARLSQFKWTFFPVKERQVSI
jgi:UDP-N-acetylmuramyl pentapeptide phosphotransferase/UDP-N-acetylglucosamine-1-phosphate transferase